MADEYEWYLHAVDVWPYGQRHVAVRAPAPPPAEVVAEVEQVVEVDAVAEPVAQTPHTDITVHGAVSIGRWLARIFMHIRITRR